MPEPLSEPQSHPAAADTAPDLPAVPGPSRDRAGTDEREPLGRIVHDVRLACEAARAEAEGREKFRLGTWEERDEHQRDLDMAIGAAVAAAERERIAASADPDLQARISDAIEVAWWSSRPASPAVMEVIAPLIARTAQLEAALRRHTHTCTDAKGTFCLGCLGPAPCPDAGLCGEPS